LSINVPKFPNSKFTNLSLGVTVGEARQTHAERSDVLPENTLFVADPLIQQMDQPEKGVP